LVTLDIFVFHDAKIHSLSLLRKRFNGKRTDDVFLKLFALLSLIPIALYFTDDWGTYKRYLPNDRYMWEGYDMED
jgi:IS1 family transposase